MNKRIVSCLLLLVISVCHSALAMEKTVVKKEKKQKKAASTLVEVPYPTEQYNELKNLIYAGKDKDIKAFITAIEDKTIARKLLIEHPDQEECILKIAADLTDRNQIVATSKYVANGVMIGLLTAGALGTYITNTAPALCGNKRPFETLPAYTNIPTGLLTLAAAGRYIFDIPQQKNVVHNIRLRTFLTVKEQKEKLINKNFFDAITRKKSKKKDKKAVSTNEVELDEIVIHTTEKSDNFEQDFCKLKGLIEERNLKQITSIIAKYETPALKKLLNQKPNDEDELLVETARQLSKPRAICVNKTKMGRVALLTSLLLFTTGFNLLNEVEITGGSRTCASDSAIARTTLAFMVLAFLNSIFNAAIQAANVSNNNDGETAENQSLQIYKYLWDKKEEAERTL